MRTLLPQRFFFVHAHEHWIGPHHPHSARGHIDAVIENLQLLWPLRGIIKHRLRPRSDQDEFVLFHRVEPRDGNVRRDAVIEIQMHPCDIGDVRIQDRTPMRGNTLRQCAEDRQNNRNVMRCERPQHVFFGAEAAELNLRE